MKNQDECETLKMEKAEQSTEENEQKAIRNEIDEKTGSYLKQ